MRGPAAGTALRPCAAWAAAGAAAVAASAIANATRAMGARIPCLTRNLPCLRDRERRRGRLARPSRALCRLPYWTVQSGNFIPARSARLPSEPNAVAVQLPHGGAAVGSATLKVPEPDAVTRR